MTTFKIKRDVNFVSRLTTFEIRRDFNFVSRLTGERLASAIGLAVSEDFDFSYAYFVNS